MEADQCPWARPLITSTGHLQTLEITGADLTDLTDLTVPGRLPPQGPLLTSKGLGQRPPSSHLGLLAPPGSSVPGALAGLPSC